MAYYCLFYVKTFLYKYKLEFANSNFILHLQSFIAGFASGLHRICNSIIKKSLNI